MTKTSKIWLRPKQKNDKVVHIKMTQSQFDTLKFASERLDMTMSDFVRYSITEFIANHL